jgi:hypothetical protein
MKPNRDEIGVGPTQDLSLRVSIATLVRVLFEHSRDRDLMLALERIATVHETENGRFVETRAQPFGGAVRILNLNAIHNLLGDFHFDSERSRAEQDFRLFIRPSSWSAVRDFCIQHLSRADDPILETDPARELAEEFADALKINLKPEQYISKPVATVVEDEAAPTDNIHARGIPTVRVYRIFEATITDASLMDTIRKINESISREDLCQLALKDAQNGGKGRANAILALPLKQISDQSVAHSSKDHNVTMMFEQILLDDTVSAILEGVPTSKYQRA